MVAKTILFEFISSARHSLREDIVFSLNNICFFFLNNRVITCFLGFMRERKFLPFKFKTSVCTVSFFLNQFLV